MEEVATALKKEKLCETFGDNSLASNITHIMLRSVNDRNEIIFPGPDHYDKKC